MPAKHRLGERPPREVTKARIRLLIESVCATLKRQMSWRTVSPRPSGPRPTDRAAIAGPDARHVPQPPPRAPTTRARGLRLALNPHQASRCDDKRRLLSYQSCRRPRRPEEQSATRFAPIRARIVPAGPTQALAQLRQQAMSGLGSQTRPEWRTGTTNGAGANRPHWSLRSQFNDARVNLGSLRAPAGAAFTSCIP